MKRGLASALLLAATLVGLAAGQTFELEGVLLPDGSLNGSRLHVPTSSIRLNPNVRLTPSLTTYSRVGCYGGAAQLQVFFGSINFPRISTARDNQTRTTYGVHTWSTRFHHSNASSGIYEVNDEIYWDIVRGDIVVLNPRELLNASNSAGIAESNKGIAYYDAPGGVTIITPATILRDTLLQHILTYGPAGVNETQFTGITSYPPPSSYALPARPPSTYLRYLQRVLYMLETITLSRTSQCAFASGGEPDLVPLTNYALGAVLDAARLTGPDPLPDYSFVDGQPIDLKAVFTNESEPAAVCLVKDNVEAVHQGDDVYAIQGDFIDEPFEAEDQGQCCSACLQQALDQTTSHERKPICNFWLFCTAAELCHFPKKDGNETLSKNDCVLGYAPQLAVNETFGEPINNPLNSGTHQASQYQAGAVQLTWPLLGLMLPQRGNNQTKQFGDDFPVEIGPGAKAHVARNGAYFYD